MKNPIMILVEDDLGDLIFEGHQLHWADCFFSNATETEIVNYCCWSGWKCEIREMTSEEMVVYPEVFEFRNQLVKEYGEA